MNTKFEDRFKAVDLSEMVACYTLNPKQEKANDLAASLIINAVEIAADSTVCFLEEVSKLCESPIEQILLLGLLFNCPNRLPLHIVNLNALDLEMRLWWYDNRWIDTPTQPTPHIRITPQKPIGRRRVDFFFEYFGRKEKPVTAFAVECDGHDYHDDKPEQRIKDKAKERELMLEGIQVLRFTGSEIFRDAQKCAKQIHQCAGDLLDANHRATTKKQNTEKEASAT
jgi:very-short-patch-repair endonuclease